jgi:hypothetical protein
MAMWWLPAESRNLATEALQVRADAKAADPIIKDLQAAGKTSLKAIAASLNEAGISTARGEWSAVQVMRILARLDHFREEERAPRRSPSCFLQRTDVRPCGVMNLASRKSRPVRYQARFFLLVSHGQVCSRLRRRNNGERRRPKSRRWRLLILAVDHVEDDPGITLDDREQEQCWSGWSPAILLPIAECLHRHANRIRECALSRSDAGRGVVGQRVN